MKRIFLTLAAAIVFTTGVLIGQTPQVITLEDAIQIALDNNFSLKQAENNYELSDVGIRSEMADFLPSVSSSLSGSRTVGRQFIQETLAFEDATTQSFSGSVSASIPIFNGFDNILSLRISQNDKLSAEENLQRAKENIIFDTATRYLNVLLDQELLDIAIENLQSSEIQLEQIQAQVEVGSRPAVDAYNQEATVANNEFTVTQRESSLQLNQLLLIRQLQIDPLGNYEFVTPEISVDDASLSNNYSLGNLINTALSNRADLRSERYNIENLEYQLDLARASLIPSLNASASISTGYSDQYTLLGETVGFGDQFFDQRISRNIGLSLSIPLFSNWNRMYNIEASRVNLKNAELSFENTRLGIVQEVTQAYTDYASVLKQYESSNKALIASEKAYETEQERYNVGASTLIELSQSQASYVSALSDNKQALYNLVFQEKLLDYYLGQLSGENIEF